MTIPKNRTTVPTFPNSLAGKSRDSGKAGSNHKMECVA